MQNPAKKGLPMSRLKEFRTKLSERADKNSAVIKFRKAFAKIPRAVRWAILGIIVLGLAGGGYAIYRNSQATTVTASTDAAMQTAVARRSSIVITASGSGTLIPRDEASAGFGASGKITQIYVKVGDEVAAGQVLAEMDSATAQSSYTSARLDYLNMTSPAAIANAEQAVLTAQTSLTSARNNLAYVISPTVLYWQEEALKAQAALPAAQSAAAADPTDENQKKVEEAQAALDKAEAGLTWAWGYYRNTYVPEYFTVTETDQRTGVETVVYVTNSNGELVPEIEAPSQATIDAAQAAYELAKANLVEAQIYLAAVKGEAIPDDATGSALAQLISAKDNYESAKLQLDGIKLVAPIAGTVMSFSAKVGDEAGTTAIVQISDLSQPYYLEAYFDESDWTNIQVGYETNVTFDLLPDSTFAGKVVEVTPGLVSGGGSSLVHAYIELTDTVPSGLPSGTAATVEVVAGRATNVITVPVEAVREISAGQYAVFVVENGTPKLRMVEVGLSDITTAEILSGLNEGEVVTTGIVETLP
jgi:HlyD family secretion protein